VKRALSVSAIIAVLVCAYQVARAPEVDIPWVPPEPEMFARYRDTVDLALCDVAIRPDIPVPGFWIRWRLKQPVVLSFPQEPSE
jgi:hypothetical protein